MAGLVSEGRGSAGEGADVGRGQDGGLSSKDMSLDAIAERMKLKAAREAGEGGGRRGKAGGSFRGGGRGQVRGGRGRGAGERGISRQGAAHSHHTRASCCREAASAEPAQIQWY